MVIEGFGWVLAVASALLIGISKTSISSAGTLSIALLVNVLPAPQAAGLILPLLLVGDVVAVSTFRGHTRWSLLIRLIPGVAVGLIGGVLLLEFVDPSWITRAVATFLLVSGSYEITRRLRQLPPPAPRTTAPTGFWGRLGTGLIGLAAGATTMVANAGGGVMTLYLLRMGVTLRAFMGTIAWFFFCVNVIKVPLSASIGLISPESLLTDLVLVPAVLLGAAVGILVLRRFSQRGFELVTLTATVLAAIWLLVIA